MDKEIMIEQTAALMKKLYYEDVEFFWGMISQFTERKGIR